MKRCTLVYLILFIFICLSSCSEAGVGKSPLSNKVPGNVEQISVMTMIPNVTPDKGANPTPDLSEIGASEGKLSLSDLVSGTIFLYDYIGSGIYPQLITIGPDNTGETIIMKNYTMNASDMFSVRLSRTIINVSVSAVQVFLQEYQYLQGLINSVPEGVLYDIEEAEIADYPVTYIGFVEEGKVKLATIDTLNDGVLSVSARIYYLFDEYNF